MYGFLLVLVLFALAEEVEMTIDAKGNVERRTMREEPAETTMEAFFRNSASKPIDLYWSGGKWVWQGSLEPGQTYNINTFEGHTFFFTKKDYRQKLKTLTMSRKRKNYVLTQEEYSKFEGTGCLDRSESCPTYAGHNGRGCETNPGWMIVNCARTCNETSNVRDYCVLRDPKKRCDPDHLNLTMTNALNVGSVDERFNYILTDEKFQKYTPHALSTDPWVMQFDTFLTPQECKALHSSVGPFERSTDTGAKNELGEAKRVLSKGRTSSNAWCRSRCENNPDVKNIIKKIVDVTGVPYENYESFQVLEYEPNQFYNTHHDRGATGDRDLTGGRILTFFLYCSEVEEGGETNFPNINLKAKPALGRAILWPSVQNERPTMSDLRTKHGALPVKKGHKIAANAWIHQRNFQVPNKWGCTGAFD